MKNTFYAYHSTCQEALSALKLSIYPPKYNVQSIEEWNEQRTRCVKELKQIMARARKTKKIKRIVVKKPIKQCNVNDYP